MSREDYDDGRGKWYSSFSENYGSYYCEKPMSKNKEMTDHSEQNQEIINLRKELSRTQNQLEKTNSDLIRKTSELNTVKREIQRKTDVATRLLAQRNILKFTNDKTFESLKNLLRYAKCNFGANISIDELILNITEIIKDAWERSSSYIAARNEYKTQYNKLMENYQDLEHNYQILYKANNKSQKDKDKEKGKIKDQGKSDFDFLTKAPSNKTPKIFGNPNYKSKNLKISNEVIPNNAVNNYLYNSIDINEVFGQDLNVQNDEEVPSDDF